MLAPSGWLRRVSTCSCLVTRSTFGSSAFNGVLALAAADVTLRRDVAFDLALPFLGVALLGFRDFAKGPTLRAVTLTHSDRRGQISRHLLRCRKQTDPPGLRALSFVQSDRHGSHVGAALWPNRDRLPVVALAERFSIGFFFFFVGRFLYAGGSFAG
jgi:hypothetical protein